MKNFQSMIDDRIKFAESPEKLCYARDYKKLLKIMSECATDGSVSEKNKYSISLFVANNERLKEFKHIAGMISGAFVTGGIDARESQRLSSLEWSRRLDRHASEFEEDQKCMDLSLDNEDESDD